MKTPLFIALAFVASLSGAAFAQGEPVSAAWQAQSYRGPAFRYDCPQSLMALENILDIAGARKVRAYCSGRYGLTGTWEALAPEKARTAVAALLSREFPALSLAGLQAAWVRSTLHMSVGDSRACQTFLDVWDAVEHELPVRNVTQNVFCGGGSGSIMLSLERLEPLSIP